MENLYKKAVLFQELQEIVRNKPALIGQKKRAIAEMEQQVVELEKVPQEQAYSILNPKRYLLKNDAVATQKEIEQLKHKINAESRALEELETLTPIEVVDVAAIQTEAQAIIVEQQPALDQLAKEVLKVQQQYFSMLEEYSAHFHNVKQFERDVQVFVQRQQDLEIQRDFGSSRLKVEFDETTKKTAHGYHGMPWRVKTVTAHFSLIGLYTDKRIGVGHKQRIVDFHGEILKVIE